MWKRDVYCRGESPTLSFRPKSSRIRRNSKTRFFAASRSTVTAKSMPTLRSEPDLSFGRIFVPKRFHTSGGTVPISRIVLV